MRFKIRETGEVKELHVYNRDGVAIDEESERLELIGRSNKIHSLLQQAVDGILAVTEEEYVWWKTQYAKKQARLFNSYRDVETFAEKDYNAVLQQIMEEEIDNYGEDHGDRRNFTKRVEDRITEYIRIHTER